MAWNSLSEVAWSNLLTPDAEGLVKIAGNFVKEEKRWRQTRGPYFLCKIKRWQWRYSQTQIAVYLYDGHFFHRDV